MFPLKEDRVQEHGYARQGSRDSTTSRSARRAARLIAIASMALPAACSAHHNAASASDAAVDQGSTGDVPTVNDTGTIVDYDIQSKPIAGATLTEGDWSTTTDAHGKFSMAVPLNTPLSLVLTAPKYTKTLFDEISLQQDADRGPLPIPLLDTYHLGQQALPSFDTTRGSVYLVVHARGNCASVAGGTVTINSPSDALMAYFNGEIPSQRQSMVRDQLPVAVVYNVPAGSQIDVTITHPACKQAPFPVVEGGVTYTGRITVEGGDANSTANYYLE